MRWSGCIGHRRGRHGDAVARAFLCQSPTTAPDPEAPTHLTGAAVASGDLEHTFHGVRCGVIHPGFTDTPMVHKMGEDLIREKVLPYTQLGRLIRPEEIADAICFMIANSAVSGELWADAGWQPAL